MTGLWLILVGLVLLIAIPVALLWFASAAAATGNIREAGLPPLITATWIAVAWLIPLMGPFLWAVRSSFRRT